MSKAVVFFAEGTEECEALLMVDLLRRDKVEVTVASASGSREIVSSRKVHITADALAEEVDYSDVDMVVLASPAAVAAVAHWVQEWPEHITLATVGEGTARVIRAAWGDDVPVIFPKGDAEQSGSEARFDLLKHTQIPRRVLIARGQTGREWLAEQLTQLGADVEKLAAYVRVPIELTTPQIEDLQKAIHGPSPIIYITSSDSVATLLHAIRPVPGAREWFLHGAAVTVHPRCAERLREAGFVHVEITGTRDERVREHIVSNLLRLT